MLKCGDGRQDCATSESAPTVNKIDEMTAMVKKVSSETSDLGELEAKRGVLQQTYRASERSSRYI